MTTNHRVEQRKSTIKNFCSGNLISARFLNKFQLKKLNFRLTLNN